MPAHFADDGTDFGELIVRIGRDGDRQAFARLFGHFAPRIKAYLLRAGSTSAAADELTQEIMLLVWRKAALFDPRKADAASWIFAIARNRRIDSLRRARPVEVTDDGLAALANPAPGADRQIETAEAASRLARALATLPAEQALLLKLAFYEDKSHSAIAATLELPLGTVKSRLRLALARLRGHLAEETG